VEKIIVIVGPTASGKTSLSVELALRFNGEIVSADSMQVYRGMDIGTAKVTKSEKKGIKHHLIDIIDPSEEFSLADYLDLINVAVKDILSRNKLPIIVGGTGLYISSFTDNIKLSPSKADNEYRSFLKNYADINGSFELKRLLRAIDLESYEKLKDNDVKRISRALEIYRSEGKTVEEFNRASKQQPQYEFLKLGLTSIDREYLYSRINNRVDIMMQQGFLDEVRSLNNNKLSSTAAQAIGYRQLNNYLAGKISLDEAIEQIKQESRRYAKRQITWFKRDKSIIWHNIDTNNFEEILNSCIKHMEIFLKMCYNKN
jgi:tRNA dimethylallyltransferase